MGWRAIRLGLDRPGAAAHADRARCSRRPPGASSALMFPMVTEIGEFAQAREHRRARAARIWRATATQPPTSLMLGAMIEVPSLLWQLDELLAAVDFVSVGSNDLMQFMMASDRGNTRLAGRFDPLSRPFLRVARQIAEPARRPASR